MTVFIIYISDNHTGFHILITNLRGYYFAKEVGSLLIIQYMDNYEPNGCQVTWKNMLKYNVCAGKSNPHNSFSMLHVFSFFVWQYGNIHELII